MMSSLYIGATGMKSLSEGMNVVTNNIANVSTVGFKQQQALYSDLIYASQESMGSWWEAQEDSMVALGQVGMGVQIDTVRTSFEQGAFQPGSDVTDLALSGDGFFGVTNADGEEFYTRAGNFRFQEDGYLVLPSGEVLMGRSVSEDGVVSAETSPIQIDPFKPMEPKATTTMQLGFNFGNIDDVNESATNPYFSMVESFDSSATPPINGNEYSYAQALRVYDAAGSGENLTIYMDRAPSGSSSEQVLEFMIVAENSSEALMSGTMTFNSSGELVDMSAFTPTGSNTQDLSSWTPASLADGMPQLTYKGQSIAVNFGISGADTWQNSVSSAADVGTDVGSLPSLGSDIVLEPDATTARTGSNSMHLNEQDGYTEGSLTNMVIRDDGRVVGSYTNGQEMEFYEIPVFRFTSDDGLYREGGNLFSHTSNAGEIMMGTAGTENFASIQSNSLEMSNVDMSAEMVNMIVTQRGFQSNSKVVTTADEMLRKAMEIKRA